MRNIRLGMLLLLVVVGVSACSDGFPDEEMHFGLEEKVRPYAIIIDPPEAAPGDTVLVTLLAQTSDPDELDISWRVAMDYSLGMYETDEIERQYHTLDVPLPQTDADGFLNQTFQWVVPDSAILNASDIPEVLDDPAMVYLAEELIGPEAGSPPTKSAVNAWLSALTMDDVNEMSSMEREATWALADRFAIQVRFRAALRTDAVVDVTRNLTVRYTNALEGPNTNENSRVRHLYVVAIEKANAPMEDLYNEQVPQSGYFFISVFDRINDSVQIPYHSDWTYYIINTFTIQGYTAPFDPTIEVWESILNHWYYYRQDQPLSEHHFFADEDGGDVEMYELDGTVRIMPDGVGSIFRVVAAVRDIRYEWVSYNAVPGQVVEEGTVEFEAP